MGNSKGEGGILMGGGVSWIWVDTIRVADLNLEQIGYIAAGIRGIEVKNPPPPLLQIRDKQGGVSYQGGGGS